MALAVELEEERHLAQQRQADLSVTSRLLADLAKCGPVDPIFTRLIDSCTEVAPGGDGLGANFALLRTWQISSAASGRAAPSDTISPTERLSSNGHSTRQRLLPDQLACCWKSGESAWLHAIDRPPLASIWQRAEEARDTLVIAGAAGAGWPHGDVARLVAIPLHACSERVGVLIAGLRQESAVSRSLERLELRAELAATALALRLRSSEVAFERARQRAILQSDSSAIIVLETGGQIGALSRGAQQLLGEPVSSPHFDDNASNIRFASAPSSE